MSLIFNMLLNLKKSDKQSQSFSERNSATLNNERYLALYVNRQNLFLCTTRILYLPCFGAKSARILSKTVVRGKSLLARLPS